MKDNKKAALELGTKPVGSLLWQYALPAIIAMTASSLYNMVDRIFIGQGVGALAISGLAVTFPFMNLSAAFGAAVGVGASTYISMKLGQRDYDEANLCLGNSVVLNIVIGIIFGAISLIFLDPILHFFGASDQTIPYARDYMLIILLGNVFSHLYFGSNAILRSAGKPRHAMYATIFTVVMNTILDPLFIWGLGLGIRGAAYATILSQVMALTWQMWIFSRQSELLHLTRKTYSLCERVVRNIISIGISPFLMNSCACLVVIFINRQLYNYGGDMAVGSYGIANSIGFLFVMVVMGLNQGMQPIVGYNYGAQKTDRMLQTFRLAVIWATVIMVIAFAVAMTFPRQCAMLFTSDETLIQMSVNAIRINMCVFFIIGAQIVTTAFFQSIGMVKISIFLSLSRQMLFLIPAIVVLPLFFGLDGVWWAMPFSDLVAAIVTGVILMRTLPKFKQNTEVIELTT